MTTALVIIAIIILSGMARLYVNRKYDVEQEKKAIILAVHRNQKARVRNIHATSK